MTVWVAALFVGFFFASRPAAKPPLWMQNLIITNYDISNELLDALNVEGLDIVGGNTKRWKELTRPSAIDYNALEHDLVMKARQIQHNMRKVVSVWAVASVFVWCGGGGEGDPSDGCGRYPNENYYSHRNNLLFVDS